MTVVPIIFRQYVWFKTLKKKNLLKLTITAMEGLIGY